MSLKHLKKRQEFLRVAKYGNKFVFQSIVAQFLPREDNSSLYIGFTVTKKVGNAVIRNRVRRRMKEALRQSLDYNKLPKGYLVLIGRVASENFNFLIIERDIQKLLKIIKRKF